MHSKQHWSSWMSIQLLWKAWRAIALLRAPHQCRPWKDFWLAIFTCSRILQQRKALAPYVPCKESKVLDVGFTRVTPSAACCHHRGGASCRSRSSATSSAEDLFSISSLHWVSFISLPRLNQIKGDSFSQIWVSSLATFQNRVKHVESRNARPSGELLKGAWDALITWETWAALAMHPHAPSWTYHLQRGCEDLLSLLMAADGGSW